MIFVDMPMGLLDARIAGGRDCDRLARKLLGRPRASSVFSPPTRAALAERDYPRAQRANGGGLSLQSFHLFAKIRELDGLVDPQTQARCREAHPELIFWRLRAGETCAPKRSEGGRQQRVEALARECAGVAESIATLRAGMGAGAVALDDAIDAVGLAWAARGALDGRGLRVPQSGGNADARGLRMEIWY